MTIEELINKPLPDEKPLDRIVEDGGFCGIFRTIGCIGDSLSSGEFQVVDENGKTHYIDMFEHSWGQYIARMTGATVYNFSRGGMTAKEYVEGFADSRSFWDRDKICQAYIIALGVNDLKRIEVGSTEDVDLNDYKNNNKETFAGNYAIIIQRLKQLQPDAKFFFVTMPGDPPDMKEKRDQHSELLYKFTEIFDNSYVIDLRKYAPSYGGDFYNRFYLGGHMNPMGYMVTAKMIASYIDYIIRNDMESFKRAGLIGSPFGRE